MAYLGTPAATKEIINKYGFAFQKKFGQNFLIDSNILENIVSAAGITKDDFVLEIGPGRPHDAISLRGGKSRLWQWKLIRCLYSF